MNIVIINGSYRPQGVNDLITAKICADFKDSDITIYNLRDKSIDFCTNCRGCTQEESVDRGQCHFTDDMEEILKTTEECDLLILMSPINFFQTTAMMKKFIERLLVYYYWPWGQMIPKARIKKPNKKAIIITTSAMPGSLAAMLTKAASSLKLAARSMGFKAASVIRLGNAASTENPAENMTKFKKVLKALHKIANPSE